MTVSESSIGDKRGLQPRRGLDPDHIDHLVEELRAGTVLPPPVVVASGRDDYEYELISGHHTLEAQVKILGGGALIEVVVVPFADWEQHRDLAYELNVRKGLTLSPKEKAEWVRRVAKRHPEHSIRKIAALCDVSKSTVNNILKPSERPLRNSHWHVECVPPEEDANGKLLLSQLLRLGDTLNPLVNEPIFTPAVRRRFAEVMFGSHFPAVRSDLKRAIGFLQELVK
jgi:ParB-like nuclease domain